MKVTGDQLREGDVLVDPHLGFGPKRSRVLTVHHNDLVGGVTIRYEDGEGGVLGSYVPPEQRVAIEDRPTAA